MLAFIFELFDFKSGNNSNTVFLVLFLFFFNLTINNYLIILHVLCRIINWVFKNECGFYSVK